MTLSPEMEALKAALLADLKNDILPAIEIAAKAAVTAANPVVGVVAAPLIDIVDSYVSSLLGNGSPAVTAPTDPEARVSALEKHVAALTVATGHGTTQNMVTAKVAATALPVAEVTHAPAS